MTSPSSARKLAAPIAGAMSDRIGGGRIMGVGLAMQAVGLAWIAIVSTPTVPYAELVTPFVLSGIGMALFFAPVANVVLGAVRSQEVASYGGYGTGQTFVNGLTPALWIGPWSSRWARWQMFAIPWVRRPQEQVVLEPAFDKAN